MPVMTPLCQKTCLNLSENLPVSGQIFLHYRAFSSHSYFCFVLSISANHPKILHVETAHGGHLGFYEGGFIRANPVTWLDRTVVSLIGSLVFAHSESKMKFTAGAH